jgi:hypothetical protein
MPTRRWLLAVAGTLMLAGPAHAQDAYKIIVNPANGMSLLSTSQLQKFFLQPATWDDGKPVMPVDLKPGSAVRESFSKDVLGMSSGSVVAHWAGSAVGSQAPLALASDADVIQFVRLKLGAIGYVSAAADVSQVKVIAVVRQAAGSAVGVSDSLVHHALTAYLSAFEARDLDALKRIWPVMTTAQMRAIRAEFDHARSVQVSFVEPRIDIKDGKAVVVARRRYAVTTLEGTKLQSETTTTISLKYVTNAWIIEDVRYQM